LNDGHGKESNATLQWLRTAFGLRLLLLVPNARLLLLALLVERSSLLLLEYSFSIALLSFKSVLLPTLGGKVPYGLSNRAATGKKDTI
jgi:hypothetical protein